MALVDVSEVLKRVRAECSDAFKLFAEGHFGVHGPFKESIKQRAMAKAMARHIAPGLAHAKDDVIRPQERPFVNLLKAWLKSGVIETQGPTTLLCQEEASKVLEEIHKEEFAPRRTSPTVMTPWTHACLAFFWVHLAPDPLKFYRYLHAPAESIHEGRILGLKSMRPAQVRAKQKLMMALVEHKFPPEDITRANHLMCTGEMISLCAYLEVIVAPRKTLPSDAPVNFRLKANDWPVTKSSEWVTVEAVKCRNVGTFCLMRPENNLPEAFAEAYLACDHENEFILLLRSSHDASLASVFVVSKTMTSLDCELNLFTPVEACVRE